MDVRRQPRFVRTRRLRHQTEPASPAVTSAPPATVVNVPRSRVPPPRPPMTPRVTDGEGDTGTEADGDGGTDAEADDEGDADADADVDPEGEGEGEAEGGGEDVDEVVGEVSWETVIDWVPAVVPFEQTTATV
ncbi:hypothetical protein GCM10010358_32180 [Streptomyces minutiscleroticus]|uniref:Uncharacterized protein n=1 Tax=Streptomyces minutiscleroticus TaxID=68238 RepID=A0A918KTU7_9ACTN|nr:hypothetical protein GCM10010358_32180 [Streptomyces minutiscleroticus]